MAQAKSFGAMNFGHAQLGDERRTRRLVRLVDQMCQRPGGTLPQKFRSPADLQAFYRLMRQDDVTHAAILAAHRQAVLDEIAQRKTPVLVIHDTTEFDFTTHKSLCRLGGHQNRKHDHPPGWQVIWEGWKELLPMVTGYDVAKTQYTKCG